MQWKKNKITLQDGTEIDAQSPIIVSASRSTDILTFYSECNYCYANISKVVAKKNYQLHLENPNSESIK